MNPKARALVAVLVVTNLIVVATLLATPQGRGRTPFSQLPTPDFDSGFLPAGGGSLQVNLPQNIVDNFQNAVVDLQIIEPDTGSGSGTTNFFVAFSGTPIGPTPAFWTFFGDRILVTANKPTIGPGHTARVRIWLHS